MKRERKYWCEFYTPGSFVAETWTRDLQKETRPEDIEWPKNAYAFRMYTREDVIDGEEKFTGSAQQIGPTYYHPDSVIETLKEVKRNPKATQTLVRNMQINEWSAVIWTRWGNWPQPWEPMRMRVLPK